MQPTAKTVIRTYLILAFCSTLAAALIWGVNTLFLLSAGLNNLQAFAANAFFTAGQVIFEVPTGVIADTWGRRTSYLLGSATLALSTALYLYMWYARAPFWQWAVASALLGLGFTFFSGATEAWLVDALHATGYKEELEHVFAQGQVAMGSAMLLGTVSGGFIAQLSNLAVPYWIRSGLLVVTFIIAWRLMHDIGFKPIRSKTPVREIKKILNASIQHGWKNPPVKWLMLAAPFLAGTSYYGFYALQPYLLKLYGDPNAYGLTGLVAAGIAAAQIGGSFLVKPLRKIIKTRTMVLLTGIVISSASLSIIGLWQSFWPVIITALLWAAAYFVMFPVRQSYINKLIPSDQRATVLSFDALMSSAGGVFAQPVLGRVADIHSYSTSFVVASVTQLVALPFTLLARRAQK